MSFVDEATFTALVERVAAADALNDPVGGAIRPESPERLAAVSPIWDPTRWERVEPGQSAAAGDLFAEEYLLHPASGDGPVPLGLYWTGNSARAYYGLAAAGQPEDARRAPFMPEDPTIHPSGALGVYEKALNRGDVDGVLATLSRNARFRDPAGRWTEGKDALRDLFTAFKDMDLRLGANTLIEDGPISVLEITVKSPEPAIGPGMTFYVTGADGKLESIRVY